ncbi:uncharacterized protein BYT42DRAFT_546047 [Radiomyces spectabilis]|uniref:uncharacterized protein n=1 Tax=Radiomyces spectabilis TaxID=64574 RepID=UPI00221F1376|nr:uncharacterized protein BYT42DRAFT_546047 [Radiomyces spectabilis]KAI8379741.1 hypothetical protein BYT42DRAFT_546047 [Radiomyces spectabilis]
MGKKKKSKPLRPWCWYCEKDFEDDKVLVTHQRAKHFKCEVCNKKLTTAGGMAVHAQQVHKVDIHKVPNALPGRETLEVEIFGMEGIPYDDLVAYEAKKTAGNANKRARTDAGSGQYGELTPEQIQAQLALHKAGATPTAAASSASPATPAAAAVTATATPPSYYPSAQPYPPPVSVPPPGMPAPYPGQYNPYYPNQGAYPPPPAFTFRPPIGAPPFPGANHWRPAPMPGPYGAAPPPLFPPSLHSPSTPTSASPVAYNAGSQASPPTAAAVPTPNAYYSIQDPSSVAAGQQTAAFDYGATPEAAAGQQTVAETPVAAPAAESGKKKSSKSVLIYNNNEESPEELRAQLEKHRLKV